MDDSPQNANAPCWTDIGEEILCPLCDYNLRGLIEPRCPECGYRFEWPKLLDPTLRLHPYVFEHHPERNIWSFWRTLRGTLLPRRFWRSLHPAQPSRIGRLVTYAAILGTVATFSYLTATTAPSAISTANNNLRQRRWYLSQASKPASVEWVNRINRKYGSFDAFLGEGFPGPLSWSFAESTLDFAIQGMPIALLFAAWPWLTFGALMVFQWSMRRANVNRRHILRCVVYSFDVAMIFSMLALASIVLSVGFSSSREAMSMLKVSALLSAAVMAYRLCAAYRLYLRFDHPILTILASQVIVGLVAFNILLWDILW